MIPDTTHVQHQYHHIGGDFKELPSNKYQHDPCSGIIYLPDEAPVGRGDGAVSQHARGKHYEGQDGGQAPGNHVIQGHQLLAPGGRGFLPGPRSCRDRSRV